MGWLDLAVRAAAPSERVTIISPMPPAQPGEGTRGPAVTPELRRAGVRVGTAALLGFLPMFAVFLVVGDLLAGNAGWAFREAFLGAAQAILDGESPYPSGVDDAAFQRGVGYVYPPVLAFLSVPFTFLSTDVAVGLFALILIATVPVTLWLCGVRDWRCYGLVFLWPGVLSGVHVENISLLMALGCALVWHYRDRPAGGVSLGVAMAIKPLLWPIGIWLVATARFRAVVFGALVATILALGTWAAIGFDGLGRYPTLLRELSDGADEWGYSVYPLALDLGAGDSLARALWLLLAVGVLAASVVAARRGDERRSFVLAVAAVIAVSPIVWLHYFSLLLVVVAVAQQRLGLVWFAPLLLWGSEEVTNGTTFQTLLALVGAALTVALALRAARVTRPAAAAAIRPTAPVGQSP